MNNSDNDNEQDGRNQGQHIAEEMTKCIQALQYTQEVISLMSGPGSGQVTDQESARAYSYLHAAAQWLTKLADRMDRYQAREARVADAEAGAGEDTGEAVQVTKDGKQYLN